jgi:hypothetical protein
LKADTAQGAIEASQIEPITAGDVGSV